MRVLTLIALLLLLAATLFGQDSLNVTRVGELPMLTDYTMGMVVSDGFAFFGGTTGFHVLDISTESSPREVARVDTIYVHSVAISGNRAYLGCEYDVKILDISDPRRPAILSAVLANAGGNEFKSIAVSGNILCAAAMHYENTLYVVDITDENNPSVLDSVNSVVGCTMVMRDSLLYFGGCTAWNQPLRIFDLHNPRHPVLLSSTDTVRFIEDLELHGDSLYAACETRGIYIVDITHPAEPVVSATYDHVPSFDAENLAVDGNVLYCVTRFYGTQIFDISIPGQIVPLDTMSANCLASSRQVERGNQRAYITTDCASFHIINTEDPETPQQVGVYDTPGMIISLDLAGGNIFTLGRDGLYSVDVANPISPEVVAVYPENFGPNQPQILVHDHWAYAAPDFYSADTTSLHIFDISNPAQPHEVASMPLPGTALKLVYDEALLFAGYHNASSGDYGIRRIDVSDPANPRDTGGFLTEANLSPLAVRGNYLYVYTFPGLAVYNIADINAPYEAAIVFDSLWVEDVALSGNYAYVCADDSIFRVVNVSDPEAPVPVSSMQLPEAFHVKISGNLAFVGALQHGLRIIDVSNPATPVEVGHYVHYILDLCVRDSLVYTAENDRLGIYRWLGATSATLPRTVLPQSYSLAAFPNPFNPTTVLSFDVPTSGRMRLAVYDITGRLVQTLADRVYAQGNYRVSFDGANLSSGIYFARMSGKSFSRTQKLVLLK